MWTSEHLPLPLAVFSLPTLIKVLFHATQTPTGDEPLYHDTMSQEEASFLHHSLQHTSFQEVACIGRRSSIVLLLAFLHYLSFSGTSHPTNFLFQSFAIIISPPLEWSKCASGAGTPLSLTDIPIMFEEDTSAFYYSQDSR